MIKGVEGLSQNRKTAWKSDEEELKIAVCKITNSEAKSNRKILLVCFS